MVSGAYVLLPVRLVPRWRQGGLTLLHRATHSSALRSPGPIAPSPRRPVCVLSEACSPQTMWTMRMWLGCFPCKPSSGRGEGAVGGFLPGNLGSTGRCAGGVPGSPFPCCLPRLSPASLGRDDISGTGKSCREALKPTRWPLAPCEEDGNRVPQSCSTGQCGGLCMALGAWQWL